MPRQARGKSEIREPREPSPRLPSHTHLSERDYSPIRCDSEHAYERKTIFNILSCPDTIHSNSFNVGPVSIASNGDVSLSLQGSIFTIVGVGGSIGVNLSEFFRGVFA